jgi:phosphotriesterase-related protein
MEKSLSASPSAARTVNSVLGPVSPETLQVVDAHNHVWIESIAGADPAAPVLNQFDLIEKELVSYRQAGGDGILDCQPGGCGRNGNRLRELAERSGVTLFACTGFHRQKYYAPDHWLFSAPVEKIENQFSQELEQSLEECRNAEQSVKAGFVKIALEATWHETPQAALEAAAEASRKHQALIEIHTEKGALAEKAAVYFVDRGVRPAQIVICHIDKRVDFGLHTELAKFGVTLEYDTFFRPKYAPEMNLWPLIRKMVDAGFGDHLALATDMAEAEMYSSIGAGPGLASLPAIIRTKLKNLGISEEIVQKITGKNIARRLAGLS